MKGQTYYRLEERTDMTLFHKIIPATPGGPTRETIKEVSDQT